MNPPSYLIIGCGHFGSQAAEKLLRKDRHARITLVDKDQKAIQKISSLPVESIVGEGIAYLHEGLLNGQPFHYIIPAVPLHLAFEFLLFTLKPFDAKRRKVALLPGLPNAMTGKTGDLYTSLANFLCPDDCLEPSQYCTMTGKRRPKPLYRILMDICGPFESRVIRSQQLGPGVGGFKPEVLMDLAEAIKKRRSPHRLILISTACRCHGVTSALSC
jgi:hypothetical protein